MKDGWKKVLLADYYTISSGLSKSADQFGFGHPFVSFKDVFRNYFLPETLTQLVNTNDKERNTCSVKKGDVFLTRTSEKVEELGMSSVALKDYDNATFNGFTKRLRPKTDKDIDPRYIGFYLRSPYFRAEVSAYSILTTRASLNNDIIGRLKINLPPLPTQQKIASILAAYDDLIENNNKRIQLLEEMAAELYKEWFVRLRFPNHQQTTIENGVPEGWEKKRLKDFGKVVTGKTPSKKVPEYFEGEVPFIKTPDFSTNSIFVIETKETLTKQGKLSQKSQTIPKGSICVSCIGTAGEIGITSKESQTNQQINSLIPNQNYYLEFLFFAIKRLKPYIELYGSSGATMVNLSKSKFENLKILTPNVELIEKYNEVTGSMFKEIEILSKKNKLLQQTRDLLLPRLISGKLEV